MTDPMIEANYLIFGDLLTKHFFSLKRDVQPFCWLIKFSYFWSQLRTQETLSFVLVLRLIYLYIQKISNCEVNLLLQFIHTLMFSVSLQIGIINKYNGDMTLIP